MKKPSNCIGASVAALAFILTLNGGSVALSGEARPDALSWPELRRESRPWAYWWWMASAVDQTNLTRELQRYHDPIALCT